MMPNINVRFAYNSYNPTTKKLKLDVQFLSNTENQRLFGMNVRFFYDTTFMAPGSPSTVEFVDFAPGYGKFSPNPPFFGNGTVGSVWFKLPTNICTYVNGAVQLNNVNATPIIISTDVFNWTRLFSIEVVSKNVLTGTNYPAFIWDKETNPANGGFMPGPDGVTITTVVNPTGIITTQPTTEYVDHFNWKATMGATLAPWGIPVTTNPVTV